MKVRTSSAQKTFQARGFILMNYLNRYFCQKLKKTSNETLAMVYEITKQKFAFR